MNKFEQVSSDDHQYQCHWGGIPGPMFRGSGGGSTPMLLTSGNFHPRNLKLAVTGPNGPPIFKT